MEIFSLGLLAPTLTYFMRTLRVLSRHCLLQSWPNHYCVKGLLLTQEAAGTKAEALVRFLLWYISPHQQLQSYHCYRIFFLLHAKKAMVYYPDLLLLLTKQLLAVIFPHFGSICSLPRKWTQQKLRVKGSPTVRRKRFGNAEQGGAEWWTGILDVLVPCCAAPGSALRCDSSTEHRHAALQWLCPAAENSKGPTGAFQFPACCGKLRQRFWGWGCPDAQSNKQGSAHPQLSPLQAQDALQFHSNNGSQPLSHQPLFWGR